MRRMIPQSFADWIKKTKNRLFVNASNKVVVDNEPVSTIVDVSDKITLHTSLENNIVKAFVLSKKSLLLQIKATNGSDASIINGSTLVTLDSSIRPSTPLRVVGSFQSTLVSLLIDSAGVITAPSDSLASGSIFHLYIVVPIGE